jgi:hypothetical protein
MGRLIGWHGVGVLFLFAMVMDLEPVLKLRALGPLDGFFLRIHFAIQHQLHLH